MKKKYQKPSMDVTFMKVDNQLLAGVSAGTKDPEEDGDPTEGQNAKAGQFDVEEDFKMWE